MTTNQDRAAQIIDAAHIETLVGLFSADGSQFTMKDVVDHLQALLPDPQPRTLKDMTPEEREACQWSQADYLDKDTGLTTRVIITRADQRIADTVFPSGVVSCVYNDELTPLPGRPRMVWPDEQATTHDDEGMAPEEVPEGEFDGQQDVAQRELPGTTHTWTLMRGWSLSDEEVALVSRLVPEVEA